LPLKTIELYKKTLKKKPIQIHYYIDVVAYQRRNQILKGENLKQNYQVESPPLTVVISRTAVEEISGCLCT